MKIPKSFLKFAGECFFKDISISRRLDPKINAYKDIKRLSRIFSTCAQKNLVVYTAFDGDHFHVLQNMRKYVLNTGLVPANPESILGYKNVVTKHQHKRGVLIDDLSILKHCNELWIFTDLEPTIDNVKNLPEGVLIELTYFLKRKSKSFVNFVPLSELLRGKKRLNKKFEFSFERIEKELANTKKSQVLEMANNNYKIDHELKKFRFFISDPLDYKYSEWLRDIRLKHDEIPLVPGLASRIADGDNNVINIGKIILSWASLIRFTHDGCFVPSMDSRRNQSIILESLKNYFIQTKSKNDLIEADWKEFSIPKRLQRERWPITEYEANLNK